MTPAGKRHVRGDKADRTSIPKTRPQTSSKTKHSISTAAIFKLYRGRNKRSPHTSNGISTSKADEKDSYNHPLAVAFNETAHEYRVFLYKTTATKINEKHDALVKALYSPYDPIAAETCPENKPDTSSSQNLAPALQIRRETEYLYLPIGPSVLTYSQTNVNGGKEVVETELGLRISRFEDHVHKQEAEIMKLQVQWETVLGEIWACGVQVLGEEVMAGFLPDVPTAQLEVEIEGVQSTLLGLPIKTKRRVSFKEPGSEPLPEFLQRHSATPKMPGLPGISVAGVQQVENTVENLGRAQIDDLKKLNRDRDRWFDTKVEQLVAIWKTD